MTRLGILALTGLMCFCFMGGTLLAQDKPADTPKPDDQPKIEVVFVLDCTGSMGGLIEGAKRKIWSIANRIASGKPTPDLKIGLVGYRDNGDQFVTKPFDLSEDIDTVFKNLTEFAADGGGDGPEHVNKALDDAVTKMTWGTETNALRMVFLVGDAPPHTDYKDGFDYKTTLQNDIVVNTVRCGGDPETEKYWQEIARLGEGQYTSIDQAGGMTAIATPMDKEMAELGAKLGGTSRGFGAAPGAPAAAEKAMSDSAAKTGGDEALAERAAMKSKDGGFDSNDLVDAVKAGTVKLENLKDTELPEEMRKMTPEERKAHIEKLATEREEIKAKLADLAKKREAYIADEMKKAGQKDEDSFDGAVMKAIRDQAKKKGINYGQEDAAK
jgi:hypothetical protein